MAKLHYVSISVVRTLMTGIKRIVRDGGDRCLIHDCRARQLFAIVPASDLERLGVEIDMRELGVSAGLFHPADGGTDDGEA